eukprot:11203481-Lingulodinium_polyedra.AAC.1
MAHYNMQIPTKPPPFATRDVADQSPQRKHVPLRQLALNCRTAAEGIRRTGSASRPTFWPHFEQCRAL